MADSADPAVLAAALSSLYAVPPEEFMAERKRLVAAAKTDGDAAVAKEIGALRKPSLAAWAVNLLAREAPDLVDGLADLGGRMRAAQGRLDTDTLTSLRPERDQLLEEVVRTTVRLVSDAGRACSAAAQQDVRATAIAALADEQAMAAVASGQLARPLSYSGFGEVDLAEAVVRTTSGAILSVVRGGGSGARAAGRAAAAAADRTTSSATTSIRHESRTTSRTRSSSRPRSTLPSSSSRPRRPPSRGPASARRRPANASASSSASWPRHARQTSGPSRRSPTRSGRARQPRPRGIPRRRPSPRTVGRRADATPVQRAGRPAQGLVAACRAQQRSLRGELIARR